MSHEVTGEASCCRVYTHLEEAGSTVRVSSFDFPRAFNTIGPALLNRKLLGMLVGVKLAARDQQLPPRLAALCGAWTPSPLVVEAELPAAQRHRDKGLGWGFQNTGPVWRG